MIEVDVATARPSPRIAVVGHVEHVTLGRVRAVPGPGDIAHLEAPRFLAGGGGGLAFWQLTRSPAELHLFSAFGDDDGGRVVLESVRAARPGVIIHAAVRQAPHPRVVVMIDDAGRRTIVVTGPPLQPAASDPLPWDALAGFDAVYFTGSDPASLRCCRAARRLVVTSRRAPVVAAAALAPDVLVGSVNDPRENAPLASYQPPPGALVLTDGGRPIRILTTDGTAWVPAPPSPSPVRGDYGAGDSFAAALTFHVALGQALEVAVARAAPHGAAVLRAESPLDAQLPLGA